MGVQGYAGISFPFRIGDKGGVVMSSTSPEDSAHIKEAICQILLTPAHERCMECHFFSDIDTDIFEPDDESTRTLIAYQAREALRKLEKRIEVLDVGVDSGENGVIYCRVKFKVLIYNLEDSTTVALGGAGN
jgi:phage baseplate assembly protein W